ncbi:MULTISPECIES: TetR family transcriptional regulator [unclassified Modestobacter]|uniref:TetR family transcriptional regulator n=1 Tax=unclassified Modestobacter TaxID=2643866 RepID=UPI0022AA1CC4|nr:MULTISPECIES: TetR family transcriptional regulator [unclassified Modestobacter]MCZ2805176.1 TetR family transcriptional regulator [Modestobacter sp. VKM Ac-2983]MCZ2826921.1 TetR family transcriptional regulator [Modestobacter sp. VKM Ac-2981]MCZ2855383.1 TetR family transcriptional regulator [Modestobacter sp. VKM Ac-2982]
MTFHRARSEEQREIRRRAILDTAAAMLDEMPVADVSLNELSRRVGLAKSNVLRYFDSREGVLLELMDAVLRDWLAELTDDLATGIDTGLPLEPRAEQLAAVLARSLAGNRVLCDLVGAQGGVLERNVTVEVVTRHKRTALTRLAAAADLLRRYVPELGAAAETFCFQAMVLAGALAPYSSPPPGVRAAYEAEPALAVLHLELQDSLQLAIRTMLLGAVPRG